MRIVAALGGNALLRRGEPLSADVQRGHVREAAAALSALLPGNELIVTHGNGPQVGLLALQSEACAAADPYPLDVLGAESEGMIGYLLEQELDNVLAHRTPVATLLTQTIVDLADPAFATPSKPIGPVYGESVARAHARTRGWEVARDGAHWRRVVASPEPIVPVELDAIRLLVDAGVVVICAGGGGIPVAFDGDDLVGVEAVVDKDMTAAVLALALQADALLLLTDVPAVQRGFGTPAAEEIRSATIAELEHLGLPAGSMAPKVAACARFASACGGLAAIGSLDEAVGVLAGDAGTRVVASA